MERRIVYPIGIQSFSEVRRLGSIYVDKTGFIPRLLEGGKYYFLSRPRRFGKSLLLSMLECYFRGKRDLFEGLAIAETEREWKQHPVVHLDFSIMSVKGAGQLADALMYYLRETAERLDVAVSPMADTPDKLFSTLLRGLHRKTGERVVVLIDEYDNGVLEVLERPELLSHNQDVLRPFFKVLKSCDDAIGFAMITGVARFRHMTLFSGLNNLQDISMDSRYATLCGITQEELERFFPSGLQRMSATLGLDTAATRRVMKERYWGYRFSPSPERVYNPLSVINAFESQTLEPFWVMTGGMSVLSRYLRGANLKLSDLTERWVSTSALANLYDTDNPLPLLYQTGYLTLKTRNEYGEWQLEPPNKEVWTSLVEVLIPSYVNGDEEETGRILRRLRLALDCGDVDAMMEELRILLSRVPYHQIETRALESHFHLCLYIVFLLIGTTTRSEIAKSGGRIDMVAENDKYVYLFEFKLDSTPHSALQQIDERGYAISWESDGRRVFKIGVNFSSRLRTVAGWTFI